MRKYRYIILYVIRFRYIRKPAKEVELCEEEAGLVPGINVGVEVEVEVAEEATLFLPVGIMPGSHGDGGRLDQVWRRTLTWDADRLGGNRTIALLQ